MSRKEIIFASANLNKIKEVQATLGDEYVVRGLKDVGVVEDIPETAATIEGNASIKSHYLFERLGCDCFSDDTGLEVEALGGEPGVYSARYAGHGRDSEDNIKLLLHRMEGVTNRQAKFRTVVSLIENGVEHLFEGEAIGTICLSRSGDDGFGYDPIFTPEGYDITFAQMSMEQKNKLSHRAKAIGKLVEFLKK